MPHIIIDYSANLEPAADIAGLCEGLRKTAAALDVFPMTGVRVRAIRADHYAIADGDPGHGYIDISVRLRAGRTPEARKAATAALFATAKAHLADLIATRPVMLSMEMRDIDPEVSPKINTVAEYIERARAND